MEQRTVVDGRAQAILQALAQGNMTMVRELLRNKKGRSRAGSTRKGPNSKQRKARRKSVKAARRTARAKRK